MKKKPLEKGPSVSGALPDEKNELQSPIRRWGLWLPSMIALLTGLMFCRRELWFDEALTLMNFVIPLDAGKIYSSYIIPNNHIVHNILLKIFAMPLAESGLLEPVTVWRLFSLIPAAAALGILMELRRKLDDGRVFPGMLVLSALAVSVIFLNYATAIRGYALGFFLVTLALRGLYDIFHKHPQRGWCIYAISSILAAGCVPSNILPLAAAVLYALPWMGEKFYSDKRFYIAAAVVPLALIVFYAPIATQFLDTFKLGEGFSSRMGAMAMILGMYAGCFGLLLLFAPWGIRRQPWHCMLPYLIWVMPLAATLVLHRAPFPRIFVPLLPVLAMLVADGIAKVTAAGWRKSQLGMFFMLTLCMQCVLIMAGYVAADKAQLDPVEDDFFRAYYMQKNYQPTAAAQKIARIAGQNKVFISFNSDPLPLVFHGHLSNADIGSFAPDVPYGRVKSLEHGAFVVLHTRRDDVQEMEKRFNCRLHKVEEIKYLTLYRVEMP